MRATVMFGAGDVRIETVPDARVIEPTDALGVVSRACICGSDLWPYKTMEHSDTGRRMGHEAIGVVEAVGADVRIMKVGDVVVMPFAYSDGTCLFCHEGLHTSCIHGGFFGTGAMDGAQAEAVRVPQADGTLFVLPVGKDDALMPSLLTLSDVMGTEATMRPSPPRSVRGREWPLSETAPSACVASSPRGASAPSRSSSSAAMPTGSHSLESSAQQTS
jgi:threonine dehydrogenase-like Zn-dependent dehydrogenase